MKISTIAGLMTALLVVGCASGGTPSASSGPGRDPNVIGLNELARENSPNAYDAIQHLRPEMLRPHLANASSSISSPGDYNVHVYLGETRLGEISDLQTVPISTIREIRYLNPTQAMQRYGSGNPGGVIVLVPR